MTITSKPANANWYAHYDETFGKPAKRIPKPEDKLWLHSRCRPVEVVKVDGDEMTVCCDLGLTFVISVGGEGVEWNWIG